MTKTIHPLDTWIDGKTPQERMAAHQAYCSTMGLSSNEARAVMIPAAARVLAGRETDQALAKCATVANYVYRNSKARLDAKIEFRNGKGRSLSSDCSELKLKRLSDFQ